MGSPPVGADVSDDDSVGEANLDRCQGSASLRSVTFQLAEVTVLCLLFAAVLGAGQVRLVLLSLSLVG